MLCIVTNSLLKAGPHETEKEMESSIKESYLYSNV